MKKKGKWFTTAIVALISSFTIMVLLHIYGPGSAFMLHHTFDDRYGMDDDIRLPCDGSFFRRYRNPHCFTCAVPDRAKPTT